jgi:hypothetical protein
MRREETQHHAKYIVVVYMFSTSVLLTLVSVIIPDIEDRDNA